MRILSKFLVLLWKNLLLKRRHWFMTVLEICVPVLLFIVLAVIRGEIAVEEETSIKLERDITYQASDLVTKVLEDKDRSYHHHHHQSYFCNSPKGEDGSYRTRPTKLLFTAPEGQKDQASEAMKRIQTFLTPLCALDRLSSGIKDIPIEFAYAENETSIEEEFQKSMLEITLGDPNNKVKKVLGGVVFKSPLNGENNDSLEYVLRYGLEELGRDGLAQEARTDTMFDNNIFDGQYQSESSGYNNPDSMDSYCSMPHTTGSNWKKDGTCMEAKYRTFVTLQQMIDFALIDGLTASEGPLLPSSIQAMCESDLVYGDQAMLYPDKYTPNLDIFDILKLFMTPTFIVISFAFTVPLVLKRIVEEKQQGVKELMKMMGLPSWLHWVGWFVITILTTVITISVMVFVLVYWEVYAKTNILILFITLFLYSLATICFNFAQSTILSNPNLAVALGIILHFGTWIPASFVTPENYFIWGLGTKMAIAMVPNMGIVLTFIIIYSKEEGPGGLNWETLSTPVNASDNMTLANIWISNLLSCIVFLIFLWYMDNVRPGKFGVAKKLWFPFQRSYWCGDTVDRSHGEDKGEKRDSKMFESEPAKERGVEVQGLRKVFKGKHDVVAVDNVTFNAYKGEITALLGHNGAGKTTTMSMLTGLFSPTGGTARINGCNIYSELEQARERMGLCPQHNMLFPSLTVFEHLIFFGMLKGISMAEAKKEGSFFIERLNLQDKKNRASSALSGGMKRKLHLAMALTGPSEILMLDEPTSGMDPEARRSMWDVLQEMKKSRTIMLTTHFMEEADVLGDRIAIMADGKVKCCGSPMFLKSNLGTGFTLTVTKESNTSSEKIAELVRKHVPASKLKNENSLEVILELDIPNAEPLPSLATALDSSKSSMGFSSFGFSKTTIEDVFLRVGEERDRHESLATNANMYNDLKVSEIRKVKGGMLLFNHFKGLFMKRMISTWRMWKTYVTLSGLSILVIIALGYIVNNPPGSEPPSLTPLSMSSFAGYDSNNVFTIDTSSNLGGTILESIEKMLAGQSTTLGKKDNLTLFLKEEANLDIIKYAKTFIIGMTKIEQAGYDFCATLDATTTTTTGSTTTTVHTTTTIPTTPIPMITMLYNPVPYHSRPLAVNQLSNFLLDSRLGSGSISMTSSPMVFKTALDEAGIVEEGFNPTTSMPYMVIMTIAMALLLGIFIIFPLKERVTNAKQVQLMAGVSPVVFWVTNFVWDFIIYLAIAMIYIIILYVFDTRLTFHSNGGLGAFVLIVLLLGLAGIPWAYILNFGFNSAPSSYAILIISAIVTGICGPLAVIFLRMFYDADSDGVNLEMISDIVRYILTWLGPFFSFGHGMFTLVDMQASNALCAISIPEDQLKGVCEILRTALESVPPKLSPEQFATYRTTIACCSERWGVPAEDVLCDKDFTINVPILGNTTINFPCRPMQSFWTWEALDGINIDVLTLAINIFIYWTILILIEMDLVKLLWIKIKEQLYGSRVALPTNIDDDVKLEKDTIFNDHINNNVMKVCNLTKKFGRFDAVRGLTFGVRDKECFGLLGVNGAGKTTTFRMLTGDEIMTSGEAFIDNIPLSGSRSKYLRSIGYCPQFDSIIEVLTGREMLTLFARIRGLRSQGNLINKELEMLASFVDLTQYLDRPCGQYSGGNKRKLNVALALIGRPKVMLLDEPTTGVDPAARRKMWETINNIRRSGTSVILTSHSMEECEALCDRLAIMVRGSFQCLGGPQHIKSKFGKGFQIIVKLEPTEQAKNQEELDEVKSSIVSQFDSCYVTDEHLDYVHFHVANPATPWSQLFRTMEAVKNSNSNIQDYSVSETTLEQIFLSFARGEHSGQDNLALQGDNTNITTL